MSVDVSRRDFLKMVGAGAVGVVFGDEIMMLGGGVEYPRVIEGVPVYGFDVPMNEARFRKFCEKSSEGLEKLDPSKRQIQILVDEVRMQFPMGVDGDAPAAFVRKHVEDMNAILARTRKEAGITDWRFEPHVVVMKKGDFDKLEFWDRQSTGYSRYNPSNVVARWSFGVDYKPSGSVYYERLEPGKSRDVGWWHELTHYGLFLRGHLYNHFRPDLENWKTYIDLGPKLKNFSAKQIKHWRPGQTSEDFRTGQLVSIGSGEWKGSGSLLSPIEERLIYLTGREPKCGKYSWNSPEFETRLMDQAMGPKYKIEVGGSVDRAILRIGTVTYRDASENQRNILDKGIEVPVEDGNITLPGDLVKGSATFVTSDGYPLKGMPRYFVLETTTTGGLKDLYGFTTWHLLGWEWDTQVRNCGKFGPDANKVPVTLKLSDWDKAN